MTESTSRKPLIRSLPHEAFLETLTAAGLPKFQSDVLKKFLYKMGIVGFHEATTLSKTARTALEERFSAKLPRTVSREAAADGTVKFLLDWAGTSAECVLMKSSGGRTLCLSSQSGCRLRCAFCATGMMGLARSLTFGEILDQALIASSEAAIDRMVLMGMGEPLENLDEVIPALAFMTSPQGLGLSRKRITLSTVGIPEAMARLAKEGPGVELAISLHAPEDKMRSMLVPLNNRFSIGDVLEAGQRYATVANAKVTIEYVLLDGVNDSERDAAALGKLSRRHNMPVNVIQYNSVPSLPFAPSPRLDAFARELKGSALAVTVRRSKGREISAACGQLAGKVGRQ